MFNYYTMHYLCTILCGMALLLYACIVYVECAFLISWYMVEPEESIGSERRRWFPLQTIFSCVWRCDISATFSCYIYIYIYIYILYEAHKRIHINIFSHVNYNIMQTKIVLIARSVESMICIHVVDIVMSRPRIFHKHNTCTSLLQDTRTTFTNVNTNDLYVNGWADLEGLGIFVCNFIPYDYG